MDRRVLLLEFVTHERWVFDSRLLPFVKGCAESLGAETRWLCYGVRIQTEKTGHTSVVQFVDLDDDEVAGLERHVRELRPTHVLVTHRISTALRDRLKALAPAASLASVSDHRGPEGVEGMWSFFHGADERAPTAEGPAQAPERLGGDLNNWLAGRTDWVLRWLGETPETSPDFDRYLVGTITPTYDGILANEAAREYRPHLLVLGGVTCDHFAKIEKNEHYAGLDLSECVHDFGCAYCTWFRGATSDMKGDPVRDAVAQLRRVIETDRGRFCGTFDILDIRLLRHIDRFADAVVRLDLPPSTFCFEPRVDRVLQVAPRLDRALTTLGEKGHGVYLFRMGAENLVEEENAFFNKEISLAQLDEGPRRLAELKEKHPDNFDYDPTWGFITCSPWTTLEMLQTNVQRAIERGLEPLGVWLYTPLLLYQNAPITVLARKEGLVVDAYEDPSLLYEPAVNNVSFASLTPWRFKDPRTGEALAFIVRFCAAALRDKYPDTIFEDDALYADLLARLTPETPLTRPDLFAREVIALLGEGAPPYDRAAVLTEALARYADVVERAPAADTVVQERPVADRRCRGFRRAVETILNRLGPRWETVTVREVVPSDPAGGYVVDLRVDGDPYRLFVRDAAEAGYFRTAHLSVSHAEDTPVRSDDHERRLRRLVDVVDRALARHAPELFPQPAEVAEAR